MSVVAAAFLAAALPAAAQEAPKPAKFTKSEIKAFTKAYQKDPDKYTLDDSSIVVEPVGPVATPSDVPTEGGEGGEDPVVVIDKIINLGKKIWAIVEANKPVVDVKTGYATGLPQGITSPSQLAGWKPPKGTIYSLTAKNKYGSKVIDIQYQVLRTYGGQYKGKGRYLSTVAIQPLKVEVLWGYKLNLDATVGDSSVTNAGTDEEPIAAMQPVVQWRISTVVKDSTGRAGYYLQGDGLFQEVGMPTYSKAISEAVKKALDRAGAFPGR
jgi:hypothetical protein